MASILSTPPDDFMQLWFDTYYERGMGIFQSYEDNIEYICQKLGVKAESSRITLAIQAAYECRVRFMRPRPHANELLSYLKAEGYKTGLITDCGAEVPKLFNDMTFSPLIDVAVFSCLAGMQKPDPQIYQLATERLEVKPEDCLYIGDGDDQELTGALQVGMHPVLIRNPDEDSADVYRTDWEAETWQGPVISSLQEVPNLLK